MILCETDPLCFGTDAMNKKDLVSVKVLTLSLSKSDTFLGINLPICNLQCAVSAVGSSVLIEQQVKFIFTRDECSWIEVRRF